ncbi:MAG TPA: hypothetical protein VD788_13905, partial [Candidatus Polarisedimenticolaceae bacterium]|nr:hypothetical protein [Candidatus Polarisedimenticolaceae bacterium]
MNELRRGQRVRSSRAACGAPGRDALRCAGEPHRSGASRMIQAAVGISTETNTVRAVVEAARQA